VRELLEHRPRHAAVAADEPEHAAWQRRRGAAELVHGVAEILADAAAAVLGDDRIAELGLLQPAEDTA